MVFVTAGMGGGTGTGGAPVVADSRQGHRCILTVGRGDQAVPLRGEPAAARQAEAGLAELAAARRFTLIVIPNQQAAVEVAGENDVSMADAFKRCRRGAAQRGAAASPT